MVGLSSPSRMDKRVVRGSQTIALFHSSSRSAGADRFFLITESWVSKEIFGPKKTDYKSRGRFGIRRKQYAKLTTVLREGKTKEEKQQIKFAKIVSKVRSAGIVREDGKLRRKVMSDWAW